MHNLLGFLLLCSTIAFAGYDRTLDLRSLSPRPDTLDGVRFPRNNDVMYRGVTEAQYDRTRAIMAMLGADEPIESILYSGVKLLLMKERVPFWASVQPTIIGNGLDRIVQQKIDANGGKAFSLPEARKIAFRIVEDNLKRKNYMDLNINYRSGQLEVFPQDMVYTTVFPEVANIYSKYIVVIDDKDSIMLDLNFWNKVHNGGYTFNAAKWADKGEFISPVLIEAEKVTGYIEYLTQVPNYQIFRPLPAELDVMFMKATIAGENLVLILDGAQGRAEGANALLRSKNNFFFADSQFDPNAEVPLLPKPRKSTPAIIGVIKLCTQGVACKVNADILSSANRVTKPLDNGIVSKITSLQVGNLVPKIFYSDETLVKDRVTNQYKITYPSGQELLNQFMSAAPRSKASSGPAPVAQDDKSIRYNFKGMKLAKDQVLYFDLPDDYRDKKLIKVTMTQRQDQADNTTPLKNKFDASPAYTSVELYALTEETTDRWRYWGGPVKYNAPKGSFFGDIESEARMTPRTLDWKITKGDLTDQASATNFSYGAMRISGLGTDPATLYELKLEYE